MFGSDFSIGWVYIFARDNFMCEIVTANVCLFHLNDAYLAPLPIVKLKKKLQEILKLWTFYEMNRCSQYYMS